MNRGPLNSTIPEDHPQKGRIEAVCQRVLGQLGQDWAITVEASDRTDWAVALLRRRNGKHPHQRNWEAPPRAQQPAAIESWLREAARQIRQESDVRFGMMPIGKL